MKRLFYYLREWCVRIILIQSVTLFFSASAIANDCNCDFTITADEWQYDGQQMGVFPGATVCIEAGNRRQLYLLNFKGSPSNPITFINCGGRVTIGGEGTYGFKTHDCQYFRVTGTGSPDFKYGIEITQRNQGMQIGYLSSDFEIDHVEIHNIGFAGIMAKTDPSCDPATWRENYTMKNVSIHDNYIHHTDRGEALYIGNSFYENGRSLECGEKYPHAIHGLKVYNNYIHDTGSDGIQVGCAIQGCEIYENLVERTGVNPFMNYQSNGIQVGEGTGGLCYNNTVLNPGANGIVVLGTGDNIIYNNLIVNPGTNGFFCDERYSPGQGFQFYHNTIINPKQDGFRIYAEKVPQNIVANNIVVNPGAYNAYDADNTWRTGENSAYIYKFNVSMNNIIQENNIFTRSINDVGFVSVSDNDYRLSASSPAINAGKDVSAFNINKDLDKNPRPFGGAYDIGAFEFIGSASIPQVSSIADQQVQIGDTLKLTVTASDPEGKTLSLTVADQPSFLKISRNNDQWDLVFYPSASDAGSYTITYKVENSDGIFVQKKFLLKVIDVSNQAPEISLSNSSFSVNVDQALSIPVNVSDPENDQLTLTSVNLPAFAKIENSGYNQFVIKVQPTINDVASYSGIELIVKDPSGNTSIFKFNITVTNQSTGSSYAGNIMYRINCGGPSLTDTDMDWAIDRQTTPSSYLTEVSSNHTTGSHSWSGNNSTDANDNIFGPRRYMIGWSDDLGYSFPVQNGTYLVKLYFIADNSATGLKQFDILIEGEKVKEKFDPYLEAGKQPIQLNYTKTIEDGAIDISLSRLLGDPHINGIEIVKAEESTGSGTIKSPELKVLNSIIIDENQRMEVPVQCISESDSVIYKLVSQPGFVSLSGSSIIITPSYDDAAVYSFSLLAVDHLNQIDTALITLKVVDVNRPPVLSELTTIEIEELNTQIFDLEFVDPDNDQMQLSIFNNPDFVRLTENQLIIEPQKNDEGTYTDIMVSVVDTKNASDTILININVIGLPSEILYRINCGGLTIEDSLLNWDIDRQTNPSPFLDRASSNHTTGSIRWNYDNDTGAPNALFGQYRYDMNWGGDLAYNFPVENGTYEVSLFFASTYPRGTNIFDVSIEGEYKLTSFDIVDEAGRAAIKKTFIIKVEDQLIDIDFNTIKGNAQVNAIEIRTSDDQKLIEEQMITNKVTLYPNPVHNYFNLKFNVEIAGEFKVSVLDHFGKIKFEELFNESYLSNDNVLSIDVSDLNLEMGVYIVVVQSVAFPDGYSIRILKD